MQDYFPQSLILDHIAKNERGSRLKFLELQMRVLPRHEMFPRLRGCPPTRYVAPSTQSAIQLSKCPEAPYQFFDDMSDKVILGFHIHQSRRRRHPSGRQDFRQFGEPFHQL